LVPKKTKPIATEARIHQSKEMYYNTKLKKTKTEKQLKPGLVAFYEIRPGNGADLCSKEKTSKGGDE